ncbi:MAG: DUF6166 domain-containing protein, partial [Acidimicrobiales bacterium]
GFAWGYAGSGPADLAHSILSIETGEDVAPEVYLRFRDEVIARQSRRTEFRLAAGEVWGWLSANRELVEEAAFLQSPPQAVIADDEVSHDVEPVRTLGGDATASAVVSACEAAWADIRSQHPQVPEAVIILGSGVERGRLVKLGHWWGARWLADGQVRGEVLLAGEALHLPADKVFEVLLHEAAHGLNAARGIKDTSRGGRYHNQRYAEAAREVKLHVRATPPYGLAGTSLTPEALERYEGTIEQLGEAIRIARKLDRSLGAGAEDKDAEGGGREGEEGGEKTRGALAASCGCGRKLRMAPSVLARGPVVCGVCGSEFSTGAEVERPGGEAVVDRSFLDRRRAAVDGEKGAADLREVVGRHRASLAFAISSADKPDDPALAPLRERHARLGVILERLGDGTGVDRSGGDAVLPRGSAEQTDAVRLLVAQSAGEVRLAGWYDDLGTLRGEPMTAADAPDAERLTRLARTLLQADGTLRGAAVEVGGREFQAGDRVIATDEVPGGPGAGVMGTVTEADPELGALRVDFPTWGEVRTPLVSALARSIDHDYAAVVEAELEVVPEAGVEMELERLGLGADW